VGDVASAADTHPPQRGVGPGEVARGVEALVDGDRLVEELAGALLVALPRGRGGCVLAGEREFERLPVQDNADLHTPTGSALAAGNISQLADACQADAAAP
jgi:hypothetical protein